MQRNSVLLRLTLLITIFGSLFTPAVPQKAEAAAVNGDLRIEVITAYNLIVDSNVESPSTYAPRAATFGAFICNDGANDLTDVSVSIGDYINGGTSTPGIYPSRTVTESLYAGTFALNHEGGSRSTRDATRSFPTLAAGSCITQYWLVGYPRLDPLGRTVTGNIKPFDDLWLEYDIWASANDGGTPLLAAETTRVTMRNEISAAANKIWPNGDNKVPDVYKSAIAEVLGWETFAPGGGGLAYPGEIITTKGIWYDLGVVGQGFDNNLDLVPDYNAWIQPVGDPAVQDPGCFQLLRPYGIIIVKLKTGGEYLIPFVDRLYFENVPLNTGAVGLVYYEYIATGGPCAASLTPYQEVASGYDNEKFNGDYGTGIPILNSQSSGLTMTKTASSTSIVPPAQLRYTISYTNSGTTALGAPKAGMPVMVRDSIPPGTTYITGSAALTNTLPSGVSGYLIQYSHDGGVTWTSTEGSAATVTDIRWWLNASLAPAAVGTVGFSVSVGAGYTDSLVSNTARIGVGDADPFAQASVDTVIGGDNSLSGHVFADDGTGGFFANGVYDASDEALLPNVTVSLYRDTDGDGTADAGEPLVAATAVSYTGHYTFSNLIDGKYVVAVNHTDSDLPVGWAETTTFEYSTDLDSAGGIGTAVTVTDLDFGFAPALGMSKQLIGNDPVYEGDLVSFVISARNRLPASFSLVEYCTYEIPATSINSNSVVPPSGNSNSARWLTPENALGRPDNLYATTSMANSDDVLGISGFTAVARNSTITNVELKLNVRELVNMRTSDKLLVKLYRLDQVVSGGWYTYTGSTAPFNTAAGSDQIISQPLNGLRSWSWTDFLTTTTELQLIGAKGSGSGTNGDVGLDSAVFVVTTNEICSQDPRTMSSVPLSDTFDASRLAFVRATIPPTTVGSGSLSWANIGPLQPGTTRTLTVTFRALAPAVSGETVTNTAVISNARFVDGSSAGSATDNAAVGVVYSGRISGVVFNDTNSSGWSGSTGFESGTDTGLPAVTMELFGCVITGTGSLVTSPGSQRCDQISGAAWTLITTTQTADDGTYAFENLRNGYYVVQAADGSAVLTSSVASTVPAGATASAEANTDQSAGGFSCPSGGTCDGVWGDPLNLTLTTSNFNPLDTENESIENVNFGYAASTTRLFGRVWQDDNADTTINDAELDLSGVTVFLCDSSVTPPCTAATALFTATTDSFGGYSFDVDNGSYVISTNPATLPAGPSWQHTSDPGSGALNHTSDTIVVSGGASTTSYDFGYRPTGTFSIGDTLYYDWNGNATQDGGTDEGINGVTVMLYRDDGDGILDTSSDPLISSTVTAGNGAYLFGGIPAGTYIVAVDTTDSDYPADTQPTEDYESGNGVLCTNCDNRAAVTISSGNVLNVDFGYLPNGSLSIGDLVWWDRDGNQLRGSVELPLPAVSVTLQVDWNNDGTYVSIATDYTDLNGGYLFPYLAPGTYRIIVNTTDDDVPVDGLGVQFSATTPISYNVTLTNSAVTTADFGFAALGAIGDTIYWDSNRDGAQGWDELGIDAVPVTLYTDVNGNGSYDVGTDTVFSTTTTVDGKYLFIGLPQDDYLVAVGSVPGSPALSADPDADGDVCSGALPVCDGITAVRIGASTAFMGADFGYIPVGSFGDSVWLDGDNDGVRDPDELGLAGITLTLNNGSCTVGVSCLTVTTDIDGYYSFNDLPNGTYTVTVDTADPDLPTGLTVTTDPDATKNGVTTVVLSGGTVTSIGGTPCSGCSTNVDFGFRYVGTFDLSGTICVDEATLNGVCDSDTSGVAADERALTRVRVTLLRWTDDGDSNIESGETIVIATAESNSIGDYSFLDVPAGTYIIGLTAPEPQLDLTTDAADTPADTVVPTPSTGVTASAYQIVPVSASTTGIDFAFEQLIDLDFGDLAAPYQTSSTTAPAGPSHVITSTPSLYLGSTAPDVDTDGVPSTAADGDGSDEDGVAAADPTAWVNGAGGGTLTVTVTGDGYLVGWMDFNTDGDFTDAGELVLNQTVSSGTATYSVTVPTGTFTTTTVDVPSRFRLFSSEPAIPVLSYAGRTSGGEVEDYLFTLGSSPNEGTIAGTIYDDVDEDGTFDPLIDTPLSGVTVIITDWNFVTYTLVTDVNGYYEKLVPIGGVLIDVDDTTLPDGAVLTTGDNDPTETLVTAGETTTVDVGYVTPTTVVPADIGGTVWVDLDGDCQIDAGETLVANLTITLTLSGVDGIFGTSDDTVSTTVTSGSGAYLFANQVPDLYRVRLDQADTDFGTRMITCETDRTLDGMQAGELPGGTNVSGINFALRPAADGSRGLIGDLVWRDLDGDGVKDVAEPALADVELHLLSAGTDGLFGTSDDDTITTTTAVDGSYSFPGLSAGLYRVSVITTTLPAGVFTGYDLDGGYDDTSTVGLGTGEQRTDVDFAYQPTTPTNDDATLVGIVWLDWDDDGVQDPDEPGLPNVELLINDGVNPPYTVITDPTGAYTLTKLDAGTYTVSLVTPTTPPGTVPADDPDGGRDGTADVTLTAGNTTQADYAVVGEGMLGDRVWHDSSYDRRQNLSELGTNGVTVTLRWAGVDQKFGTSDDAVRTTVTDVTTPPVASASPPAPPLRGGPAISAPFAAPRAGVLVAGYYWFDNLPAGDYRISISRDLMSALGFLYETFELDGSHDGTSTASLAAKEIRLNIDFGFSETQPPDDADASLSGTVWLDIDGDGTIDSGEAGIPFAPLVALEAGVDGILGNTDDVAYLGFTDSNGDYSFSTLPPGDYRVLLDRIALPAGLTQTFEDDSTLNGSISQTLVAAQAATGLDFGFRGTSELSGTLWIDTDKDGVVDIGESKLTTVTVTVTWCGPDGLPDGGDDVVVSSAVTGGDGMYSVSNLPAGTYLVTYDEAAVSSLNRTYEADAPTLSGPHDGRTLASVTLRSPTRNLNFGFVTPPTAVELSRFSAVRDVPWAVTVAWSTVIETDSFAFAVYRATSASFAEATSITPQLIRATGSGSDYRFVDRTAERSTRYFYWLVETEVDGDTLRYGPVSTASLNGTQRYELLFPFMTR